MYRKKSSKVKINIILLAIFAVCLLILAGLFIFRDKLPWTDGSHAGISPTPGNSEPAVQTPSQKPTPTPDPTPTPTPTPDPTPTPEVTDPELLVIDWDEPPSFVSKSKTESGAVVKKYSDGSITYSVLQGRKIIDYKPDYTLAFASDRAYSVLEGVTAFRGNNYRNSASFGTRDVVEKKLEIVWTQDTGAISASNSFWPGSGWTGQPLIVHWDEDVRRMMNISPEMKEKDLVEVIYPILDGNIYFLDLETGQPTRPKINIGFSIKGTGMVDPRGYPLFYTGMGLRDNNGKYTEFKFRIINLIDQTELFTFPGVDPDAYRQWGAMDSSPMLDRQTDTLIEPMENGMVNKIKLNTEFDRAAGTIKMSPEITKYRYRSSYSPNSGDQGIECSAAFYRNLMYFGDNGGTIQCLDINSMEPVWIFNAEDDTDSSLVVSVEDDGVYVYTANEVDKRCAGTGRGSAPANIRKLNALTGELVWQKDYICNYQYYINGGVLGTPLIGKDDISDLIIYPICFTGTTLDGKLVALDKKTGNEVWARDLSAYSWSSPVDIKSSDGKTYGIFCDFAGDMHLFDPKTGEDLDVISLGKNIESSPAVYNDMIVVGSYAQKIFGIRIK
jgi:hypothetical protein